MSRTIKHLRQSQLFPISNPHDDLRARVDAGQLDEPWPDREDLAGMNLDRTVGIGAFEEGLRWWHEDLGIRRGGGRHSLAQDDPRLLHDLRRLVDPATRGDPMSPLLWTCKSTRNLADALTAIGHELSHQTVGRLLTEMGYSLQSNRKTEEGKGHPDRDAQFEHINGRVRRFQRRGQPVVSVDTKKKEIVGNYKNPGREREPKGRPRRVKAKDFPDKELGKVAPYGVYDLTANEGWVNVGIDHDTAEFAVESIRRWWFRMGRAVYPGAKELLITADSGGSNGSRNRLWKVSLQGLADEAVELLTGRALLLTRPESVRNSGAGHSTAPALGTCGASPGRPAPGWHYWSRSVPCP
jgi:hypothetical protein